jgi:BirA family biotin operon repressor/biotin-[acetyl-CoA-carboxylase] ligase
VNKNYDDPIDSLTIANSLTTHWLGKPVYTYPEITSTNERLKEMALEGAAEGTLVLAEYQSQGKGRLSRSWIAPKGSSLLFSLLFRPEWSMDQANWLVMMAGLAAKESIQSLLGLDVQLKWPNDVLVAIENKGHKVAGLLLELMSTKDEITAAILGIGINVNNESVELSEAPMPAASLGDALGYPVHRLPILIKFLELMEQRYDVANRGESPQADWEKALVTIGKEVTVSNSGSDLTLSGQAIGTDRFGRLVVRDKYSTIHKISAGDVTLRG